jgi:shikimate dehydrogenase
MSARFGFIGVTASASSINAVFPRWAAVLGLGDVELQPFDLPLDTSPETYREVLVAIRDDPDHRGALVTSHKVRLLDAASDLFHELDPYAELCWEVSCVSKRDGHLIGHAKDPFTSGQAMDAFLPPGYFGSRGAHVLCLGAGGSGLAIAINLLTRPDRGERPERVVLVNRGAERLEVCRKVLERLEGVTTEVAYVANADADRNAALVASLPAGSMVVNATGMGKDVPGSPLPDDVVFPLDGIAWELNYRGDLRFQRQAEAQARERGLRVEDGWRYFIHGWSEVIAEAFALRLNEPLLGRLSDEAGGVRKQDP